MSEPYIGQISVVAFNFAPRGWALCNGQLLSISTNQALFSLLGTTYGGNGQTTHSHNVNATTAALSLSNPTGNLWAASTANQYAASPDATTLSPAALGSAGGGQPHSNMQPSTVLNFVIALQGIFPSRN